MPAAVGDLAAHRLATNNTVSSLNDWPFVVDGAPQRFAVQGQWRANDTGMAAAMVLEGLGIGRLSTLVGEVLAKQGLLVPVLAGLVDLQRVPVYAVTAGTRQRLPKIKACLDYWSGWFGANGGVAARTHPTDIRKAS